MIIALMIGRAGSRGYPNKNIKILNKKKICEYPIIACKKSKFINKIYIGTDCKKIIQATKKYKVKIIDRPKYLNSSAALGEDVYKYCYDQIKKKNHKIELIVLLMANAPTLNTSMLDNAIKKIRKNKKADSIISVSKYNMWSPLRARKVNSEGYLDPFVNFEYFGNPKTLNCDRDSQGDVYFADMSFSIIKPRCLENMHNNLLPQKWMGNKILPYFSDAGLDIDYEWQFPQLDFWIKNYKNKIS